MKHEFQRPFIFSQCDERWADHIYSNHGDKWQTMKSSGSAPTLCADIVVTLTEHEVDPWVLAQQAMDWGYRTYDFGTAYGFFGHVGMYYGFDKVVSTRRYEALEECLDAGGLVICAMGPGAMGNVGNYYLAWAYDDTSVHLVTAHSSKPRKVNIGIIKHDLRRLFCFYPKKKANNE